MRSQPCARETRADQRLLPYACLPQPRIRSRRCLSIAAWPQRHNRAWLNSDVMWSHSPPTAASPKTGMRVKAAKQCWFGRAVIVINGVTQHMRRRDRELARPPSPAMPCHGPGSGRSTVHVEPARYRKVRTGQPRRECGARSAGDARASALYASNSGNGSTRAHPPGPGGRSSTHSRPRIRGRGWR